MPEQPRKWKTRREAGSSSRFRKRLPLYTESRSGLDYLPFIPGTALQLGCFFLEILLFLLPFISHPPPQFSHVTELGGFPCYF